MNTPTLIHFFVRARSVHKGFTLFTVIICFVESLYWVRSGAINVVDTQLIRSEIGVSAKYVDTDVFTSRFEAWLNDGAVLLWASFVTVAFLLLDLFLRRSRKEEKG